MALKQSKSLFLSLSLSLSLFLSLSLYIYIYRERERERDYIVKIIGSPPANEILTTLVISMSTNLNV